MKVEKVKNDEKFWEWTQSNLPKSLRCETFITGYGALFLIYRRDYKKPLVEKLLQGRGDPVAKILFNTVELFHPEFFSDFEDLCRKYETSTGEETKLKYWEG